MRWLISCAIAYLSVKGESPCSGICYAREEYKCSTSMESFPLGWEGVGVGSLGREVPFGYASLDTCVFLLILNHII